MCYHVVTGGDDMIMRGEKVSSLDELKGNFSIDELFIAFTAVNLKYGLGKLVNVNWRISF